MVDNLSEDKKKTRNFMGSAQASNKMGQSEEGWTEAKGHLLAKDEGKAAVSSSLPKIPNAFGVIG